MNKGKRILRTDEYVLFFIFVFEKFWFIANFLLIWISKPIKQNFMMNSMNFPIERPNKTTKMFIEIILFSPSQKILLLFRRIPIFITSANAKYLWFIIIRKYVLAYLLIIWMLLIFFIYFSFVLWKIIFGCLAVRMNEFQGESSRFCFKFPLWPFWIFSELEQGKALMRGCIFYIQIVLCCSCLLCNRCYYGKMA